MRKSGKILTPKALETFETLSKEFSHGQLVARKYIASMYKSKNTIDRVLKQLLETGLLAPVDKNDSMSKPRGRGRPPTYYRIVKDAEIFVQLMRQDHEERLLPNTLRREMVKLNPKVHKLGEENLPVLEYVIPLEQPNRHGKLPYEEFLDVIEGRGEDRGQAEKWVQKRRQMLENGLEEWLKMLIPLINLSRDIVGHGGDARFYIFGSGVCPLPGITVEETLDHLKTMEARRKSERLQETEAEG